MAKELCLCDQHQCGQHDHLMCACRVTIFSPLDKVELQQVVGLIKQKKFEKESFLLLQGDINENLIIVNRGKVKVFGNSRDGKEHIMYVLSDGDFYGARDLLQVEKSNTSVQAMEDTLVCMIAKSDFQQLLGKFPSISIKIMEVLCNRLEKMEALVRKISPRDVDSRIGMMLLELLGRYGRPHDEGTLIELPMSREEMAYSVGITRETISRKLTRLKEDGVIRNIGKRQILILDEMALERSVRS